MRVISRASMKTTPVSQAIARMTAGRPCVISQMGPPIAPRGYAQGKCGAQSLSMNAPVGRTKLKAVPIQIQYLVVALARIVEVSVHAAAATIEANSK